MNDDTRSLTELLQRATPEPALGVDFDQVAARVRRRRTASRLAGSGAILAVCLTIAGAVLLTDGNDDVARDSSLGPADSASPRAVTPSPGAGCPPTKPYPDGKIVDVDWAPFIHLGGKQFVSQPEVDFVRGDLGEQVSTVTCKIADLLESGREEPVGDFLDGNAAYLAAGTPLYAVAGFDPACRVAAVHDGVIDVYLAQHEVNGRSAPAPCATEPTAPTGPLPADGVRAILNTYCGFHIRVDGQLWLLVAPLEGFQSPPGWDQHQWGTLIETGPGRAEFRADEGQRAEFELAAPDTPAHGLSCD